MFCMYLSKAFTVCITDKVTQINLCTMQGSQVTNDHLSQSFVHIFRLNLLTVEGEMSQNEFHKTTFHKSFCMFKIRIVA